MKSRDTDLIFSLYLEEVKSWMKKKKKWGKERLMAETGSVELEIEAGWWVLSIEEACPLRPGEAAVGRRGEPGLWNHL